MTEPSIALQIGGWQNVPSKRITEIYRLPTSECQNNQSMLRELPVPLRAHVAINIDNWGLLVCGGTSETMKSVPGRQCYVFEYNTGKWKDFHKLNVGRLNAYAMQINSKIHIIGGSSTDPFNPYLNTEEVIDLNSQEGWQQRKMQDSVCSQVDVEVVHIRCANINSE